MNNPLVSIIIPVYNGADYLQEAINSALAQTYPHVEVIVINDGSTDNSEEIALSYGDKISYFAKPNGGVSSALNLGIEKMKGAWFSWLSHDDMYLPHKIEEQVKLTTQYEDAQIIVNDVKFINQNSEVISRFHYKWKDGLKSSSEALLILNTNSVPNGCAMLINRSFIADLRFNEKLIFIQDKDFYYRLFASGAKVAVSSNITTLSRVHAKQVTLLKRDAFIAEELTLLRHVLTSEVTLPARVYQKWYVSFFYRFSRKERKALYILLRAKKAHNNLSYFMYSLLALPQGVIIILKNLRAKLVARKK